MARHVGGALAEEERRPAGRAHHRAGMTPRIAVDDHDGHRGVAAAVKRLLAARVRPEVPRECGTQVVVEPDRRILRFAMSGPGGHAGPR
jgi:hypothetical protein